MSTLSRIVLCVLSASPFVAGCTERALHSFSFTSTLVPTAELTVRNVRGGLRLRAAPAGTQVTGTVRVEAAGFEDRAAAEEAALGVSVAEVGGAADLLIETRLPAGVARSAFTVVLDLTVPDGVVIDVQTTEGRVAIERLAVANVETTGGEILLSQTEGDAVVRTTRGGGIHAVSHAGALDARTVDGPIALEGVSGSARALTTNGPVTALVTPLARDDEIILSTTRARIDLVVDRRFGARLLATTTAPGRVTVDHRDFRPTGSSELQAEGTIGTGEGVIDLRTTEADIRVEGR
jgi:hypothetical protein